MTTHTAKLAPTMIPVPAEVPYQSILATRSKVKRNQPQRKIFI